MATPADTVFSDALRLCGLTIDEAAAFLAPLDVTRSKVVHYSSGKTPPPMSVLMALAVLWAEVSTRNAPSIAMPAGPARRRETIRELRKLANNKDS